MTIALTCIFSVQVMSKETVKCPENDFECLNQHINSAQSIEISKTERSGKTLIESTAIKFTNSDHHTSTEFPDQTMSGFKIVKREKSVEAVADISIDQLKAIKKQPNNSIFTKIIQICPDLRLSENLKNLNGTKAQCTLNEGITVTYVPEDIYWCGKRSGCRQGPFPSKMDERLQLFSDGLSPYHKCHGSLIDRLKSICKISDWNVSDSIIDSFQTQR